MTLFEIILLFQIALSGGARIDGGVILAPQVSLAADCATETAAQWSTAYGDQQQPPYGVTAADTQFGDACMSAGAISPTPTIP